jgi:NADH-quinone oxidoreductase subunit E
MDPQEVKQEIALLASKWKDKQGNLIMILHELQNHYGYVPRPAALELSKILGVPLARIYEVITLYNFFKLEAPGKHKIAVCMGTACYLKGAPVILNEIKTILNVEEGGSTKDKLFQLDVVRCLGCCGLSPVIKIDDKVYGKVKKSEVMDILSQYGNSKKEG